MTHQETLQQTFSSSSVVMWLAELDVVVGSAAPPTLLLSDILAVTIGDSCSALFFSKPVTYIQSSSQADN